jgi:chromosome segregation ATPase
MGRAKKYTEVALKAAVEMLPTTKNQTIRLQLIRSVLQYEQQREERTDARKAQRLRRNENKEIAQLRTKVNELTAQSGQTASAKDKEIDGLNSQLGEAKEEAEGLRTELRSLQKTQDEVVRKSSEVQEALSVTNEVLRVIASTIPKEKRISCATNLFGDFRSKNKKALDLAFTSMGLSLNTWLQWEKEYGKSSDRMLELVLGQKKPPEDLYAFLRLKLSELGMDYVDAIEAIRQYRDVETSLLQLQNHVRPHMIWSLDGPSGFLLQNRIPHRWMPTMTNDHLRNAMRQITSPELKLEWLKFVKEMLKPEGETGTLLQKEIMSLR